MTRLTTECVINLVFVELLPGLGLVLLPHAELFVQGGATGGVENITESLSGVSLVSFFKVFMKKCPSNITNESGKHVISAVEYSAGAY